jgi:hypothetical protein
MLDLILRAIPCQNAMSLTASCGPTSDLHEFRDSQAPETSQRDLPEFTQQPSDAENADCIFPVTSASSTVPGSRESPASVDALPAKRKSYVAEREDGQSKGKQGKRLDALGAC